MLVLSRKPGRRIEIDVPHVGRLSILVLRLERGRIEFSLDLPPGLIIARGGAVLPGSLLYSTRLGESCLIFSDPRGEVRLSAERVTNSAARIGIEAPRIFNILREELETSLINEMPRTLDAHLDDLVGAMQAAM